MPAGFHSILLFRFFCLKDKKLDFSGLARYDIFHKKLSLYEGCSTGFCLWSAAASSFFFKLLKILGS